MNRLYWVGTEIRSIWWAVAAEWAKQIHKPIYSAIGWLDGTDIQPEYEMKAKKGIKLFNWKKKHSNYKVRWFFIFIFIFSLFKTISNLKIFKKTPLVKNGNSRKAKDYADRGVEASGRCCENHLYGSRERIDVSVVHRMHIVSLLIIFQLITPTYQIQLFLFLQTNLPLSLFICLFLKRTRNFRCVFVVYFFFFRSLACFDFTQHRHIHSFCNHGGGPYYDKLKAIMLHQVKEIAKVTRSLGVFFFFVRIFKKTFSIFFAVSLGKWIVARRYAVGLLSQEIQHLSSFYQTHQSSVRLSGKKREILTPNSNSQLK